MDELNKEYDRAQAETDFLKMMDDPPEEVSDKSKGAKEPEAKETEAEVPEEEADQPKDTENTEEDLSEESESTEEKPKRVAEDDDEVSVKVGEEEHKVSVKDLKRLFGQEKALTQKSQVESEKLRIADELQTSRLTALNKLIDHARSEYEPYSKIDFNLAATQMSPEDYTALREAATKAGSNYRFLTEELQGTMQQQQQEHQARFQAEAQAAIEILSDPEKGIKGWGQAMYNDIRQYATTAGMSPDIVNNITDPQALKMLWKAMQFDRGQQVATKKIATAVKKPIKGTEGKSSDASTDRDKNLMKTLQKSGSRADAQSLFERMLG